MQLIKPTDDPGVCPFCMRNETITEPGIEGVNATICRACTENIQLRTAAFTHIHGETTDFDVYVYAPENRDEWPLDADPVFISGSATAHDVDYHTDTVTYDDLSETEQQFVTALTTNTYLDEIRGVERVEVDPEWESLVYALHPSLSQPHDSSLDDEAVRTVASRLPGPTAIYSSELYTTSPDAVREQLEQFTTDTETTQETLV